MFNCNRNQLYYTISCAQGIVGSIVEVFAMTVLVYLVLPETSPGVGIMLLCGVFYFQIVMDIFKTPNWYWGQSQSDCCGRRNGYNRIQSHQQSSAVKRSRIIYVVYILLENKIMRILALLLQISGIIGFIVLCSLEKDEHDYVSIWSMVGYPLVILFISPLWSNIFQDKIAKSQDHEKKEDITARFKSSKYCRSFTIVTVISDPDYYKLNTILVVNKICPQVIPIFSEKAEEPERQIACNYNI